MKIIKNVLFYFRITTEIIIKYFRVHKTKDFLCKLLEMFKTKTVSIHHKNDRNVIYGATSKKILVYYQKKKNSSIYFTARIEFSSIIII